MAKQWTPSQMGKQPHKQHTKWCDVIAKKRQQPRAHSDHVQCRPWDGRDAPLKRNKLGKKQSFETRDTLGKFSNSGFLDLESLSGPLHGVQKVCLMEILKNIYGHKTNH